MVIMRSNQFFPMGTPIFLSRETKARKILSPDVSLGMVIGQWLLTNDHGKF